MGEYYTWWFGWASLTLLHALYGFCMYKDSQLIRPIAINHLSSVLWNCFNRDTSDDDYLPIMMTLFVTQSQWKNMTSFGD